MKRNDAGRGIQDVSVESGALRVLSPKAGEGEKVGVRAAIRFLGDALPLVKAVRVFAMKSRSLKCLMMNAVKPGSNPVIPLGLGCDRRVSRAQGMDCWGGPKNHQTQKTRVNSLKFVYARIKSVTEIIF